MSERKNIKRNKGRKSSNQTPFFGGAGHGSRIKVTVKSLEEEKKQLKLI